MKRQRFCDREDLGKIWKLGVVELLHNCLADKFVGVLVDDILEVLASL